jgi:hypothetical protein
MSKHNNTTNSSLKRDKADEPKPLQVKLSQLFSSSKKVKVRNFLLGLCATLSLLSSGISDAATIYHLVRFGFDSPAKCVVGKPKAAEQPEAEQAK